MSFIDWSRLRNPVLAYDHWSIKDACCAWRNGTFHLFFSAFDQHRSMVVAVTTTDFISYSAPELCLDGVGEGHAGLCSPDLVHVDGKYYMTLNSWGDQPGRPNQLFYMESGDMQHWSAMRPLAAELTRGVRAIDAALAHTGSMWVLIYRRQGPAVAAIAPSLDGPWRFAGEGKLSMRSQEGEVNARMHENFTIVKTGGVWRMVCTVFPPHHAYLYTLGENGHDPAHWLTWTDGRQLSIPVEEHNTVDTDNAASLCDWRGHDGYYYVIYAGKSEVRRDEFLGLASSNPWPRGWNRLFLARSRDLRTWYPAGKVGGRTT